METLPFDFKAWRTRMNLTGEMAAAELMLLHLTLLENGEG